MGQMEARPGQESHLLRRAARLLVLARTNEQLGGSTGLDRSASQGKWATPEDIGNLVAALDDIFDLQNNMCGCGIEPTFYFTIPQADGNAVANHAAH